MEGVGFAIRDALEDVTRIGLNVDEIRLIGGGSSSNLWAGIICDILQREVVVPEGSDAAFGAALIAGISAGMYEKTPEFINNLIQIRDEFKPDSNRVDLYNHLYLIYKKADEMTAEISHLIKDLQSSLN
jgi:xylulokinase